MRRCTSPECTYFQMSCCLFRSFYNEAFSTATSNARIIANNTKGGDRELFKSLQTRSLKREDKRRRKIDRMRRGKEEEAKHK
jgi:hypothetical protein